MRFISQKELSACVLDESSLLREHLEARKNQGRDRLRIGFISSLKHQLNEIGQQEWSILFDGDLLKQGRKWYVFLLRPISHSQPYGRFIWLRPIDPMPFMG